jgi:hypothetical protein
MLFEAEGQWTPSLTGACIDSSERGLKAEFYRIVLVLMDFGLLLQGK